MKKIIASVLLAVVVGLVYTLPANVQAQACSGVNDTSCPANVPYCRDLGPNGGTPGYQCYSLQSLQAAGGNLQPVSQMQLYIAGQEGGSNDGVIPVIAGPALSKVFGGSPSGGTAEIAQAIRMVYVNKPASTGTAIADFKKNIGLPTAYAQSTGYGFESLNPILGLWKIMRNLALGGFVIIFVAIGIMIMLRKNIDPRTIVTVQQSLPRVVIALILVIFSYAICGLLIDTMTVATRGGLLMLQSAGLIAQGNDQGEVPDPLKTTDPKNPVVNFDKPENAKILLSMNIFGLFDQLYNVDLFLESVSSLNNLNTGFDTVARVLNFSAGNFGVQGVLRTVLWIAVFTAMLRVFFMLLTAYLSVVLNIIFSPLRFLMSAIPGSETTFESWLRGMMRHLLVFPVVFFLLCFAAIFNARATSNGAAGSYLWKTNGGEHDYLGQYHPNYWNVGGTSDAPNGVFSSDTTFWAPPALGNWYAAVGPLLSFAILLTIPRASNMITEALKLKPGSHEGAAAQSMREAAQRVPLVGSLVGR